MHWDSVEGSEDSWVKNSGASFHATHSSEALQNLKVGDFGKVRLANDECSQYMVRLPSEGVTVPVQKINKVWFTESGEQKRVTFASGKPRATGKIQVERAWKGSEKPVREFRSSGSTVHRVFSQVPGWQWVRTVFQL
jgi:hypothetical protein